MQMNLQLPDTVEYSEFDVKMFIAAKLYEGGRLSTGQAAVVAGVSNRTFIELLGQYGVSLFQQTPDELLADIANAKKLLR